MIYFFISTYPISRSLGITSTVVLVLRGNVRMKTVNKIKSLFQATEFKGLNVQFTRDAPPARRKRIHPGYGRFADFIESRFQSARGNVVRLDRPRAYSSYEDIANRNPPHDPMAPLWRRRKVFKVQQWAKWYDEGRR